MIEPHKEIVNGYEFWMLPVEGGTFLMGSAKGEGNGHEKPKHKVAVSDFYFGKFPVTQALWHAVVTAASVGVTPSHLDTLLKPSPSRFQGDDRPVEQVSWDDVQVFLKKLNDLTKSSRPIGHVYRLPTEAEWEYAARGGKYHAEGYKYAGSDRLKDVGWFFQNSESETKPVGLKSPNQLGLHDMSGNVWEWCEDDWHGNYKGAPKNGSAWVDNPKRSTARLNRGGGWVLGANDCRATIRNYDRQDSKNHALGFRLALALQ